MSIIMINATQIKDVLMETNLVEGKDRLKHYYDSFDCLEGKPVIERIDNHNFRLITYYENFQFYKQHQPKAAFECELMLFNDNVERYITLLKQLLFGKARSSFNDKYVLIKKLRKSLTPALIAKKTGSKLSEIDKYIYANDKYKDYLEYSIRIQKRSVMENVVLYIKTHKIFKERAEDHILELVIRQNSNKSFSMNNWKIIKWVLESIKIKFSLLNDCDQITLINEINESHMNVLSNHFISRCDQLLGNIPSKFEHYESRPPLQ